VRGLNSKAKQESVRCILQQHGATIVCLQETKLSSISDRIILNTLGQRFLRHCVSLPATGTRGGVLLACDENYFSISDVLLGTYSVSAVLTMRGEGLQWSITVVYRPQLEPDKINFLSELEALQTSMKSAWLIIGDFNLIYKASDKNNDRHNRRMMQRFRGLIDKLQVKELYLPGRRFSWAGEGINPTQTKIDRAFVTTDWDMMFGCSNLYPLSSACSDHAPLFLVGNEKMNRFPSFRFEAFWLKIPGFLDIVTDSWTKPILSTNRLAIIRLKLRRLAQDLKRWSRNHVGDIKLQLAVATEVIFQLEVAQESRVLADGERALLSNLKNRILALSVLNKIQIRQRSRLTWIKEGDVNSKFFHIKANSRRRKNFIQSLQTPSGIAISAQDKENELYRFFKERLASASAPNDAGPRLRSS
jgi:hypothetical protein